MADVKECELAGKSIVGECIAAVTYVGLHKQESILPEWDFGDWHWPAAGVEFKMKSGRTFYAIWDCRLVEYELTFAEGSIRSTRNWLHPTWRVTEHPRWQPFCTNEIAGCLVIAMTYDAGQSKRAPVAVRLSCPGGVVWIVAAMPRNGNAPRCLTPDDMYLGMDEIVVLFGDAPAQRLGLTRMLARRGGDNPFGQH